MQHRFVARSFYFNITTPFHNNSFQDETSHCAKLSCFSCSSISRLDFPFSLTSGGEKFSISNLNSVRGFVVVDDIKSAVENACLGFVSSADILATVAQDYVATSGGPTWSVLLGRRDGFVSISINGTDQSLPSAFDSLYNITSKFKSVGLDVTDVVSLPGLARCAAFNNRLFNFSATGLPDSSMDTNMLLQLQALCGNASSHGYSVDLNLGNSTTPLDRDSTNDFGNHYFQNLLNGKALLSSDLVLLDSDETVRLVQNYSISMNRFFVDFAKSMVKMANISPLTRSCGEIHKNCRRVN